MRGDIRRQQGEEELAEADFRGAITLAREMSAKAWKLRAATSLARLGRDQGKRASARDLLAPVYRWFTEGFDTADLKDTAALLAELSCHDLPTPASPESNTIRPAPAQARRTRSEQ